MRTADPKGKTAVNVEPLIHEIRRGEATQEALDALLSAEGLPQELLETASGLRDRELGRSLRFYYPLPRFPNVSVTGSRCALRCKHCGGYYLAGMENVDQPWKLREFASKLQSDGGVGLLISGGSDARGKVPLEPFYETISWIKESTDLIVNIHTGLLSSEEAKGIAETGVDIVSVDVVGSDDTIRRVYGLSSTVDDYRSTLASLRDAGMRHIVPHICVGLDYGELKGEARALRLIRGFDPENIVILGLMPTPGTAMENAPAPRAEDMAKVVAVARLICPRASVSLGCMRSRLEKGRLEELVIRAGADSVVLPTRSTLEYAEREGFEVKHLDGCCSIPRSLEYRSLRDKA
jgi:uncharacterized radical SAM superfamily protein